MKSVKVEDAVGMVLAHDLTKIVPGVFKGAAFKKGHIIREEDIELLKDIGKYNVFVVPLDDTWAHEDEAAIRLANAVSGRKLVLSEASEGKVTIKAAVHGLLKINTYALNKINLLGELALVSLHNNSTVEKNQTVAASKIIPLAVEKGIIEEAEQISKEYTPVIDVKPLFDLATGIIVTGSEVYYGRIKDRFGDVIREKVLFYGGAPLEPQYAPDDADFIHSLIMEMIQSGVEIILVTGGMAVDADDVTPLAIKNAASEVITYGMPILPGAMCMISYYHQIPIIGMPACGMFHKTTVLDVIFPRLLAKEKITREDIISLAHGGLCLHCEVCRYPVCPFCK
jgi:hypothetical protein